MRIEFSKLHSLKWQDDVTSMEYRGCLLPDCSDILTEAVCGLSQCLQTNASLWPQ
jgi:hypothetical protein